MAQASAQPIGTATAVLLNEIFFFIKDRNIHRVAAAVEKNNDRHPPTLP
jgi:hypothetical protein